MTAISRIRLAWILLIVALSSAATLAVAVPLALAQDSPGEVEVVGVIKAIEGGITITVNGLRINTAGAEIQTAITVGAAVKVEGMSQPDGTIRARQVKAAEADDLLPGEIEIVGALQTLTPTSATVNGLVFDISTAEVQPGLTAGVVVKVHARLGDGGVWLAREIERFVVVPATDGTVTPPAGHRPIPAGAECTQCHASQPQVTPAAGLVKVDDGGLEIIGTLDEMGTGYVVVGGQRFDTTGAEIKGQLIVGALVKLELTRLDSGILVAREVKPTTFDDDSADDMDDDSRDDSMDDSGDDDGDDSGDDSAFDGDDDDSVGDSAACAFEIKVASANLRSGPGTGYDVIGYVLHDQKFAVLEIDATGTWIKVALPGGQQGWLAVSVGELDDDCSGLPVGDEAFKDDDHSGDDDSRDDSAFDDSRDDSGDDDHSGDRMDDSGDDSGDDDHGDKSGDDSGDDDHRGDDRSGDDD